MSMKSNKVIPNKFSKIALVLMLLILGKAANALPITFAFSGEVSWDFVDVPVGTVLFGSVTYDSNTPLVEVIPYRYGYLIDSLVLNINGESATHSGGAIRINGSRVEINAGPSIYAGGGTPFSNAIAGITIVGIGISLSGLLMPDVLPDDPTVFYGLTGSFGINRSGGDIYDINSLANLSIPPGMVAGGVTGSVPEPSTLWLLSVGVLLLGFKYRFYYVFGRFRTLALRC